MAEPVSDPDEVKRILVERAALSALFHLKEIDSSLVSIVNELGLLGELKEDSKTIAMVIDVMSHRSHERRLEIGSGPVIVIRRSESEQSLVILTDHFCSSSSMFRAALLKYFVELDQSANCLSRTSRSTIDENKKRLIDSENWLDAALALQDVLSEDFSLNIMGLRQCLDLGFDQGAERYLSKVLRPALPAIDSLSLELLEQQSAAESLMLSSEKAGLSSILDLFFETFGHLPFSSPSVCDFITTERLRGFRKYDLWQELWQWADQKDSPFAVYHVITLYLANDNLVPRNKLNKFWTRLESITGFDVTGDSGRGRELGLRSELACHFCCYLESTVVGNDGVKVANFSWWLAEKVAEIVDWERQGKYAVSKSTLRQNFMRSRFEWSLLRFPVRPSALRYCTLILGDAWSIALCSNLREKVAILKPRNLSPNREKELSEELIRHLLRGCHLLSETNSPQSVFSGSQVIETAEAWMDAVQNEESKAAVEAIIDLVKMVGERAEDHLRLIPKAQAPMQLFLGSAARSIAYTTDDVSTVLWPLIRTDEWIKGILGVPDCASVLEVVFDSMLEIQGRDQEEWKVALPHFLATLCVESVETDAAVLALLGNLLVISSVSGQTVSALRRIRDSARKAKLDRTLLYMRQELEVAVREGSPWLVSRIRPALAELNRFGLKESRDD